MAETVTPIDRKRHAAATLRNREPIADVLRDLLPEAGSVLEIASGSGEHAVYFAGVFPGIAWQPSDANPDSIISIAAWSEEAGLPNLLSPIMLDVRDTPWAGIAAKSLEAVISINMIHIAPWECCRSLMAGAAAALKPGGLLFLYGPFKIDGGHTAPSNEAFDADLRAQNPEWGIRDVADVMGEAAANGFAFVKRVAMPANNQSLVFRR